MKILKFLTILFLVGTLGLTIASLVKLDKKCKTKENMDISEFLPPQVVNVMINGKWNPSGITCKKVGINVFQVGNYTLTIEQMERSKWPTTTWFGTYNSRKNTFQLVYTPLNRDANSVVSITLDSGQTLMATKYAY